MGDFELALQRARFDQAYEEARVGDPMRALVADYVSEEALHELLGSAGAVDESVRAQIELATYRLVFVFSDSGRSFLPETVVELLRGSLQTEDGDFGRMATALDEQLLGIAYHASKARAELADNWYDLSPAELLTLVVADYRQALRTDHDE